MLIVYKFKRELPIGLVIRLLLKRLEQLSDSVRSECRFAKDTHNIKYGSANFEVMLDDGNEAVCDDGDMYLDSHCISDSPQNRLTWRCCLIHLKNSSTCHLYL